MKSARALHAETERRMRGTHVEPAAGDSANLSDDLRCSTPNCLNRWTENCARGKRCSPCADRMRAGGSNRQLFTRPPALEVTKPQEDDDGPLPF